jgi:DNA-binding MarR family transcriptional regulator
MNTLIYTVQIMNNKQKEDTATLGILQAIENNRDITQRHLADRLDVALGLANSYLKRCVRKGLVKIHQAPANRYLYYLTPKGFAEKSRLTAEYLSTSFSFYRRASDSLTHIYKECEEKGWYRILFCGVSELAEIASIRALEHNITVVGTWDPGSDKKQFLHHPVWQSLADANEYDACLLTALSDATAMHELLREQTDIDKILVPSILGISSIETDTTK